MAAAVDHNLGNDIFESDAVRVGTLPKSGWENTWGFAVERPNSTSQVLQAALFAAFASSYSILNESRKVTPEMLGCLLK